MVLGIVSQVLIQVFMLITKTLIKNTHWSIYIHYYYYYSYAVNYWLNQGLPRHKLVIGLATYGRSWTLQSAASGQTYDSPAKGAGNAGLYTQSAGTLAYYEIYDLLKDNNYKGIFENNTISSYIQSKDQFISFDDEYAFEKKAEVIKTYQPGGIAIWAIDMDYFKKNYPLISTIYNSFTLVNEDPRCGDEICNGKEDCNSCEIDV